MANPYPVKVVDDSGATRIEGELDFTDPGNTPGGATFNYITAQAGPPAGPYQTPLVHDTTAVSGGIYAWDGESYVRVTTGP